MLSMNSLLTLLAMLSMLTLQCNQCIDCIADHCHPVKVKEYLWNSYLLDVRPMPTEIACLLVSLNLFLELRKAKKESTTRFALVTPCLEGGRLASGCLR